ncbi:MAG: Unknown protein [uncultured Campylobacterales bacterium]|uniref:Uncharacterized protein n=1 Tax=uncultured Campylobacterales bacterium TaxID=352960 RepID=A0A6S6SN69_9BACT|nr:MAG: Unknown protein [uncultured Campylobacterales bacterium]
MKLFDNFLKYIKYEKIDGLRWELVDLYSDIEEKEEIKNIDLEIEDDIYIIKVFLKKIICINEIDSIIIPYINVISYKDVLFYEREKKNNEICYNILTSGEDLNGFALKIRVIGEHTVFNE